VGRRPTFTSAGGGETEEEREGKKKGKEGRPFLLPIPTPGEKERKETNLLSLTTFAIGRGAGLKGIKPKKKRKRGHLTFFISPRKKGRGRERVFSSLLFRPQKRERLR